MPQLILMRHGESEWNRDQRFTGWADVGLTARGCTQMHEAGALLRREGLSPELAFTSVLGRCIRSQWAVLEGMGRVWVPIVPDWRLNERHYGALTGMSKTSAIDTFGADAVQRWRRSFDVPPPPGWGDVEGLGDPRTDERYAALPAVSVPSGESLAQVVERVRPVWTGPMAAALGADRRVMVLAHGNSLRALLKLIEGIADNDIASVEVPNAVPIVFELDTQLQVVLKTVLTHPTASPASEIL